jgi:geranylgeranylglycerol-phosphate geranylgeranyltransferase
VIPVFLELMRPHNCLMAGIAAMIGLVVANPQFEGITALLVFVTVFLITGAGNGVNDYFDREIDSHNRPNRPIPSQRMDAKTAFIWSIVLFASGCILASQINIICLSIAVFNSFLLYFYAKSLKVTPLAGNLCIGYLTGSTFLFGGATLGIEGAKYTGILFLLASLATVSREIEKDIEDMEGDLKSSARTLPILAGEKTASRISALFLLAAIVLSYLAPLGKIYLAIVTVADILFLLSTKRIIEGDASGAQRSLKVGMAIALFAFFGAALFKSFFLA